MSLAAATAERESPGTREFHFTSRDFERTRKLIYQRAGISLSDSKQDMVYSRLSRRLRDLGLRAIGEYLDLLESGQHEEEWQNFTNALTTNLTAFFREPYHFDILKEHLGRQPPGSRIMIWCAAASTGEEPYSLAIACAEHFGTLNPPVRILASDIDTQVLETGSQGVYPIERVEKISAEQKRLFFRRGAGANAGYCRVVDELRNLITFRQINLLEKNWGLRGPFTAIFCRNVMIYFDKPTQHRLLQQMAPLLGREGLFFAGHSESLNHAADVVKPVGRTVYKRVAT